MREIKFRAWFKGEKYPFDEHNIEDYEKPRMIYDVQNAYAGRGIKDEHNGFGYISCFSEFFDEDNFIVMQYTGLKDKNGREIYEGDIVSFKVFDGLIHVSGTTSVYFSEGAFRLNEHHPIVDYIKNGEREVIGNIYEHPELVDAE